MDNCVLMDFDLVFICFRNVVTGNGLDFLDEPTGSLGRASERALNVVLGARHYRLGIGDGPSSQAKEAA